MHPDEVLEHAKASQTPPQVTNTYNSSIFSLKTWPVTKCQSTGLCRKRSIELHRHWHFPQIRSVADNVSFVFCMKVFHSSVRTPIREERKASSHPWALWRLFVCFGDFNLFPHLDLQRKIRSAVMVPCRSCIVWMDTLEPRTYDKFCHFVAGQSDRYFLWEKSKLQNIFNILVRGWTIFFEIEIELIEQDLNPTLKQFVLRRMFGALFAFLFCIALFEGPI